MKHFRRLAVVLALLLCAVCCAVPASAEESTGAIGGASFRVEQIYVNVPEMDIFLYATDQDGAPISPTMVQAAGVELKLGNTTIPTGVIGEAAEPICYLVVVDTSTQLDDETFSLYKSALRQILAHKGANDQIALFAADGSCVLPATEDAPTTAVGIRVLSRQTERMNPTAAASGVYRYVNANFQSLAPRKALFVLTESDNLPVMAGLAGSAADNLNMDLTVFATAEYPELFDTFSAMAGNRVQAVAADELSQAVLDKMDALAGALEIKTELPESSYGEKMEKLTLSVPKLGSAISSTNVVYMGHKLAKPAADSVEVVDRHHLQITFNQTVDNADRPGSYLITSEDIWNFRVVVSGVELSADGRTALLTTADPLYEGRYGVRLKKVTSRMAAANISDSAAERIFSVTDWPRDKGFYLARFRLPALVLGGMVAVLALWVLAARRRDRAAEREAEAEHLLSDAATGSALPRRWVTLYLRSRRSIAETRWSGVVESSLLVGSDAAQCDLCLADSRVRPQHCVLAVDGDALLVCPIGDAAVTVNGERIAGEHRLQNNDTIGIGRTTLQLVL